MKHVRGFTLVEILVVIAIIAVLAAILFPVISSATRTARKAKCMSNLRQLVMAHKMYSDDHDRTIVPARAGSITWCQILQPQIKNDQIIICPEDDTPQIVTGTTDLPHSYGINYSLAFNTAGSPFVWSMSSIDRTSDLLLFFDMKPDANAMGASYLTHRLSRVSTRHRGRCGIGFLDGHAKPMLPDDTTRPVNMWIP
jgi:prepilin-type N-terminal cleavage/methylation domain-containing protein/prepilin-type processing-associated H-X9-DG protein